jgi:hypothetical protein
MSAGSGFGSLTNILVVGAIWAIFGAVILVLNQYIQTMPLSQDAMNCVFILETAYGVSGVIYLLASILNHWVNSKNEANMRMA